MNNPRVGSRDSGRPTEDIPAALIARLAHPAARGREIAMVQNTGPAGDLAARLSALDHLVAWAQQKQQELALWFALWTVATLVFEYLHGDKSRFDALAGGGIYLVAVAVLGAARVYYQHVSRCALHRFAALCTPVQDAPSDNRNPASRYE